jgi:hypothetical protein
LRSTALRGLYRHDDLIGGGRRSLLKIGHRHVEALAAHDGMVIPSKELTRSNRRNAAFDMDFS